MEKVGTGTGQPSGPFWLAQETVTQETCFSPCVTTFRPPTTKPRSQTLAQGALQPSTRVWLPNPWPLSDTTLNAGTAASYFLAEVRDPSQVKSSQSRGCKTAAAGML